MIFILLLIFFFLSIKFIFVFYFVNYAPVTYGTYEYPGWAEALGLLMACSSMIFIPGYAVYYIFQQKDCTVLEVSRLNIFFSTA
jgi:hypothetical protein